jgi:hypothetical protein
MAHFAEIDSDGIVLRVVVIDDTLEAKGAAWCQQNLGGTWLQTSYTGRIRKTYAGPGYRYDASLDAFMPPQPYPHYLFDTETWSWVSPTPYDH